ncbi:hypothetical protein BJ508DRAFT_413960 [Ascobolus immersus RN42]|uniref:Ubiquitin-conjugating enzyme E2 2 n=1 Tax=Ascobolus immersus RN42 TaxID=1160509 RepID=A0A3N4IDL5_ASCIM|nr:hypothetical protein BJ508DRAFT_413960 [Ascobolus immersus RN42]
MATHRRILRELEDMAKDKTSGMQATVVDPSDYTHLEGEFLGPPGTPYEGGRYLIDITLPANYPFLPPKMYFKTKVWHPNISSQTGAICLDTLSQKWSPVLTIKTALLSLQSLLDAPEPSDPQDAQVANMMINNPTEYRKIAREWAIRYANAPRDLSASASTPVRAAPPVDPYAGYKKDDVENFVGMGFEIDQVVAAMVAAGVPKGKKPTEDQANSILDKLFS